jgi:deazaflavin-dependent oxidoreductase (nitroreductase family)
MVAKGIDGFRLNTARPFAAACTQLGGVAKCCDLTNRFSDRLPDFGILTQVGRKSGMVSRTPVNVFRAPEGFLVALTYGRDCEWVKNVLVAGGCELEIRGVRYLLSVLTILTLAKRCLVSGSRTSAGRQQQFAALQRQLDPTLPTEGCS